MEPLKIGLLGVGHLGKIHLKCIRQVPSLHLTGFFDPDDDNAHQVQKNGDAHRFGSLDELLDASDVVDIVTPTTTHYELAAAAIRRGKHVFIEKPLTYTLHEAEALIELSKKYGVKVQVGHVERFNPAFLALEGVSLEPMFIEAHRLSNFNPRGTDVSVILDLMIHDIDLVLRIVNKPVKQVSASGVPVVSNTPDIANARIEFTNGCIANLTASRISLKQMRKMRLFQKYAYISLDLLEKKAQIVSLYDKDSAPDAVKNNGLALETNNGVKLIQIDTLDTPPVNAIEMELRTFSECILNDTQPIVPIEDGMKALQLAHQILEDIEAKVGQLG